MRQSAVMIFSGGMDSVCFASHLKKEYDLAAITFLYGQRADKETAVAKKFAKKLGLRHKLVDIGFMKQLYSDSNLLTHAGKNMPDKFDYSVVVPVRNAVFLSIATAWAYSTGAGVVAYGAHTGDTHYPDCRPVFAKKMQDALNEGESDGISMKIRRPVRIVSPFQLGYSKADLVKIGYANLGDEIFQTWSCYVGNMHHCGRCESCKNRMAAFAGLEIKDKTSYMC